MKIKKIYQFLLLFASLSMNQACNESLLDEDPKSTLAPDNTFVSTQGFETALTGLYVQVRDEWGWYAGGLTYAPMFAGTDLSVTGNRHPHITPFEDYADNIYSSTTIVNAYWNWAYTTIANANLIIEAADNEEVNWKSPSDKNRIKAEARFIRAYAYRELIYLYGDVPLVDQVYRPFRLDFERNPVSEVVHFMIEDLKFAVEYLPETAGIDGKLVKGAAQHLLAETYLKANQPDLAEQSASDLINSGVFQLMQTRFGNHLQEEGDVFSDLFKEHNQNRTSGNLESIWVIQQEYNVNGGGAERFTDWSRRAWGPYYSQINGMTLCDSLGGRSLGRLIPLDWWIDAYEEDDIRASKHNIRKEYWYNNPEHENYGEKVEMTEEWKKSGTLYPSTTKFYFGKSDDDPSYLNNDKDRVKFRLAETYLLLAEAHLAQGELDKAANAINTVRNRANASPITAGQVSLDFILDERARELFGEVPRRITLNRVGKLLERVKQYNPLSVHTIRDYHVLWPIPQTAIDANSEAVLEQNEGYE
ncbi:RagB/SusD family nutrient uptake outer membrane protein [Rapidithrix thailandica]|uniref:RagB/SusD family nutrient uptake outer membrane protein n=1 Tax=Rapidithrix thailandica TaxID=413964 RepID=A0AAW9SCM9_9BACT